MVAFYIKLYNEHNLSIIAKLLPEHANAMFFTTTFLNSGMTVLENDKFPQYFPKTLGKCV